MPPWASLVAQLVMNQPAEGDYSSIRGFGRSLGEGIHYPIQSSWASLVAQTVKNPSEFWETWVQSLSWEDPLEEDMATHSSVLASRTPRYRAAWRAPVGGIAENQTLMAKHSAVPLWVGCQTLWPSGRLPL